MAQPDHDAFLPTAELLDAVCRRVLRCADEKTAAAVLTEDAGLDVRQLLASTPPPDGTPQPPERLAAVAAVAMTHWFRSTSLPAEVRDIEIFTAFALFAVLHPLDEDRVPADIGTALGEMAPADVASVQVPVATMLQAEFRSGGRTGLLDWAIALFAEALEKLQPDHVDRLPLMVTIAGAVRSRFELTADPGDPDRAVSYARRAVTLAPTQPTALAGLSASLLQRYDASGAGSDLAEAIDTAREAARRSTASDPNHAAHLATLSDALEREFERTGGLEILDESVDCAEQALAAAPPGPEHATFLIRPGTVLQARFDHRGRLADLERSIAVTREALLATGAGARQRVGWMANLAGALAARHARTGAAADLDDAVDIGRRALREPAGPGVHRTAAAAVLASALRQRFGRPGDADLDEAIDILRDAVVGTGGGRHRAASLGVLCTTLQTRFDHRGRQADLDDAIAFGRASVAELPAGAAQRPLYLSNLGGAYQGRFQLTGALDDLERAIDAARRAVASTPPGHPELAARSTNLAVALQLRHEHTGQLADLDETIATLDAVATTLPAEHPEHQILRSNLGAGAALPAHGRPDGSRRGDSDRPWRPRCHCRRQPAATAPEGKPGVRAAGAVPSDGRPR